jgi:hypothetical protein
VTHWTLWLLLLTAVVASGCRETCTSAEIRHGDECVLRPDAGREGTDAESSRVTSSDGPEDAGPGDTAETSSSNDEPSPPNNNSACAPDSATADESCKADPCTPNPCGHGTCSVVADSFSCRCEAGWIGESICDTNTNATLSALVTSEGKLYPAFDPGIHEYTVDVGVDVAEIALIPTATVPDGVVIKVDGEVWNPMAANAPHALALNDRSHCQQRQLADVRRDPPQNPGVTSRDTKPEPFRPIVWACYSFLYASWKHDCTEDWFAGGCDRRPRSR